MDSNWIVPSRNDGSVRLREHYRIKGRLYSKDLGIWFPSRGLVVPAPSTWERRGDMTGTTVWVALKPLIFLASVSQKGEIDGLMPDILRAWRDACNFTLDWWLPGTPEYGSPLPNGSWNGIIGIVQRREADVGAAPLVLSYERAQVMMMQLWL